jgi:hypothetical protein
MSASIATTIQGLRDFLDELPAELKEISDADAATRRSDGGWCRKEILGPLIDSATVNHQRFVRGQIESGVSFVYGADQWVELHRYRERPWAELIALWTTLNGHLLHVVAAIPEDKLQNLCGQGGDEPWTLAYRIPDYLHHLRHHVEQIRAFRG